MNKTVLITGATGKLGSAIARHLSGIGWNLVLTSRNITKCIDLSEELRMNGVSVNSIELDLLNKKSSVSLSERLADMNVSVTHLISNAPFYALKLDKNGIASKKEFLDELNVDVVSPYCKIMEMVPIHTTI